MGPFDTLHGPPEKVRKERRASPRKIKTGKGT